MDNVNDRLYQLARMQIDMVKSALGKRFTFEDDPNNEAESGYTTYGTLKTPTAIIVLRLSNHICSMKNWAGRYDPKRIASPKLLRRMGRNLQDPYKDRCFFSVVFKAFDYQPNDNGKWKAVCNEYVFNPLEVEENRTIGIITQDCAKLSEGKPISVNGVNPTTRTAIVPKKPNKVVPQNNQELNTEQYMNKKLIRLTEQDLHKIVKESVNRILKEDDSTPNIYNNRSMFAKLMYQTMSKMHDINETLFYNVLNGRINQFKILSNEEKDRLVEIAEMANKLNGNIAYLSEMLESQSSSQFEHEPEDWYERNEHGDFDTY